MATAELVEDDLLDLLFNNVGAGLGSPFTLSLHTSHVKVHGIRIENVSSTSNPNLYEVIFTDGNGVDHKLPGNEVMDTVNICVDANSVRGLCRPGDIVSITDGKGQQYFQVLEVSIHSDPPGHELADLKLVRANKPGIEPLTIKTFSDYLEVEESALDIDYELGKT